MRSERLKFWWLGRSARRATLGVGLASVTLAGIVGASGDDRVIWMYHIHTKETIQILYKKNGRYIPEALKQLNWFLRDWRTNQTTTIDPKTIDIVWEMHAELGSQQPVHIISAYRSRDTNEMLRKTRGGQASQSQHITGKAIDIHFPDVPIRRLRYSAMIRERGGVGYYPTSALPFVHVDTARVRSWPRLPHDELALLFPSGRSQHLSAEGRSLSPGDAQQARLRQPQLAQQVAQFFDIRSNPRKGVMVAALDPALPIPPAPRPAVRPQTPSLAQSLRQPASRPNDRPNPPQNGAFAVAALSPPPLPARKPAEPAPRLVREPRPVERSSTFSTAPSKADRQKLDELVSLAALNPVHLEAPRLVAAPKPAQRPGTLSAMNTPEKPDETTVTGDETAGSLTGPPALALPPAAVAEIAREGEAFAIGPTQFVTAPAFDEDHPEDLAYQPFPIAPLLTDTPSSDDPVLARMVHPDVVRTLEMLDDEGRILPMKLRPGLQVAQLLFAKQFTGQAVDLKVMDELSPPRAPAPQGLAERSVKTSPR